MRPRGDHPARRDRARGRGENLLESSASLRIEARPIESAASALSARWPVISNTTWLSVQAARDEIPAIVRTLVQRDIDVLPDHQPAPVA